MDLPSAHGITCAIGRSVRARPQCARGDTGRGALARCGGGLARCGGGLARCGGALARQFVEEALAFDS
jgi:hypothetical protein